MYNKQNILMTGTIININFKLNHYNINILK